MFSKFNVQELTVNPRIPMRLPCQQDKVKLDPVSTVQDLVYELSFPSHHRFVRQFSRVTENSRQRPRSHRIRRIKDKTSTENIELICLMSKNFLFNI